MASLIMRARQLDTISSRTGDELWRQMSSFGYRLVEPPQYEVHCEDPGRRFRELISIHFDQLAYSIAELAEMTGITEYELKQIYEVNEPRPKPFIVK